ncbi:MAG: hypothetical protein KAR42_13140 [candidate division Zixibacteria bacterium]|nr:hypothetical protein [candidate division Zixibacteria bacterium]
MKHNLIILTIIALLITSVAIAQDYGITFMDEPYVSTIAPSPENMTSGSPPPFPSPLEYVTDSLSVYIAGQESIHQVGFQLPETYYFPHGIFRGRQVVISFPPEFDLRTISSITYRDTDDDTVDPEIAWVFVYHNSVVIRFRDTLPGTSQPHMAFFTIRTIDNPIEANEFRVVVQVDNFFAQTVAGPSYSEFFSIIPDSPENLTITPTEDFTLLAGDMAAFAAEVTDQYGNIIEEAVPEFSLDTNYDTIGQLIGSMLNATTTGTGRVIAGYEDLTAFSGFINVVPGPAAKIILSLEADTIEAGQSLNNDVEIIAYDEYDNIKIDYEGSVWFESDDPLAEIENDEYNPYRFTTADHGRRVFSHNEFVFQTAGQRVLSILTEEGLADSTNNIQVTSDGLLSFSVSYPEEIYAGSSFIFSISNAVDSYNNPFTGLISITGGVTSPNGLNPVLPDIFVYQGQGSSEFTIYGSDEISELILSFGDYSRLESITVLPADLDRILLDLHETQFSGHPFIDGLTISLFDTYGNRKTDISNEYVFSVSVDSGTIAPSEITPDQFTAGVLFLENVSFSGEMGNHLLIVSGSGIEEKLVIGQAEFVVNGISAKIIENYYFPPLIPQGWVLHTIGDLFNPGNLTPDELAVTSGFDPSGAMDQAVVSPESCLPEPGIDNHCRFYIEPNTEITSGPYTHTIIAKAVYDYNGHQYEVITMLLNPTEILPFEPLSIINIDYPQTAYPNQDSLIGTATIANENEYDVEAQLTYSIQILDSRPYTLGKVILTYQWPSLEEIEVPFRQLIDISPGVYPYRTQYIMRLAYTDGIFKPYYGRSFNNEESLEILGQSIYSVDGDSVTPISAEAGAALPFTIPLQIYGQSEVTIDGAQTIFQITDGQISSQVRLTEDSYISPAGTLQLTTLPLTIPEYWVGKNLSGLLHIIGEESSSMAVDTFLSFDILLNVVAKPSIQIVGLAIDAPNAPFVNINQEFNLLGKIYNSSTVDIIVPMTIVAQSDGESEISDAVIINNIPAGDTATVTFTINASSMSNPAERFYLEAVAGVDEALAQINNDAIAVIQIPANMSFSAAFLGYAGVSPVLDLNEAFIIRATYQNDGQAAFSGGSLLLDFSGSEDFGVQFPLDIPISDDMAWGLISPNVNFASQFTVSWGQSPIDNNTGLPVTEMSLPAALPFTVEASITRLVIQADSFDTKPLERNVTSTLFNLSLENVTTDTRNQIGLKTIKIIMTDRNGNPINADFMVEEDGSGFYFDDVLVSTLSFDDGKLVYHISNTIIAAGEKLVLECRLQPKTTALTDFFNMRLESDDITAEFTAGPRTGQQVPVTGILDRAFEINLPQAIIATEFAESFKNYPNPFSPYDGQTEFIYNLPEDSDVDIYIYSATGERVRHLQYMAGSLGGQSNELAHAFWDGKNGNGDIVLNGVYIAYIEVAAGNLKAKIKMAVVK